MEVYSKYNKPYKLSRKPVKKEGNGSVYDVSGDSSVQVKLLDKAYCTDAMERSVEDAIFSGTMDPAPREIIYYRNRFAGYVIPRQEEELPIIPDSDPLPVQNPVPQSLPDTSSPLPLLAMIAFGILGSVLVHFAVFPALSAGMDSTVRTAQFNGIPMIIGGWILLLIAAAKSTSRGWGMTVFGSLGFVLGAAFICGLISAVIGLFFAATGVLYALLPTIITIVVIVVILKSILGGGH